MNTEPFKLDKDAVINQIKALKEELAREVPDAPYVPFTLSFFRNDEEVARAYLPERDVAYRFGRVGAYGFEADALVLAAESYQCRSKINPMTDEVWEPGEMEFLFHNYPELAKEVLSEGFQFAFAYRDAPKSFTVGMRFKVLEDHTVEWSPESMLEPLSKDEIGDFFKLSDFGAPTLWTTMEKLIGGESLEVLMKSWIVELGFEEKYGFEACQRAFLDLVTLTTMKQESPPQSIFLLSNNIEGMDRTALLQDMEKLRDKHFPAKKDQEKTALIPMKEMWEFQDLFKTAPPELKEKITKLMEKDFTPEVAKEMLELLRNQYKD